MIYKCNDKLDYFSSIVYHTSVNHSLLGQDMNVNQTQFVKNVPHFTDLRLT